MSPSFLPSLPFLPHPSFPLSPYASYGNGGALLISPNGSGRSISGLNPRIFRIQNVPMQKVVGLQNITQRQNWDLSPLEFHREI